MVGVVKDVLVVTEIRASVENCAPGVRKRLIQLGCVRIDASTGSTNPLGRRVRKSLFGSRFESILVFSVQLGENRSAHCPAMSTHRNPISRMIGIMIQSRLVRSMAFISKSVERQSHKDCCARIRRFVITWALQPDAPMMSIHDAACNGKSKAGSTSLEFCFP